MVCDCGSTNIRTQMDVGCDIDPSGEERQHLDTCQNCGKSRFWVHRWDYDTDSALDAPKVYWEKSGQNRHMGLTSFNSLVYLVYDYYKSLVW